MLSTKWRLCYNSVLAPRRNATYKVTGKNVDTYRTCTQIGKHEVCTDLPHPASHGTAPQPVEVFLAALIGCELSVARFVAKAMDPPFPLQDLEFDIHAERDSAGPLTLPLDAPLKAPAKVQRIWGTVKVTLSNNSAESPERVQMLKEQVMRRCPIADMINDAGIKKDIAWELAARS